MRTLRLWRRQNCYACAELGILNSQVRELCAVRGAFRLHQKEFDEGDQNRRLMELNVQEQCLNVLKTVEAQCVHRGRNLQVHGWVFDMGTGRLKDLDSNVDELLERISEFCHVT